MPYDYKAKTKNIQQLNDYMLAKTNSMFEYQGLPDTIPDEELEKILQKNGYAFITKVDGVLYALTGTLGGVLDAYGNPVDIIISNVYLNFFKILKVATDGVLIRNDTMRMGLLPLYKKSNTFLVENDINMMVWGYNSRAQKLISASDDKTKESAEQYLKKIVDGDLSVVGENALFDGVKIQNSSNTGGVTAQQMVEFQQYIKATMYNEVGISANFNMKRERLVSDEVEQTEDSLFPFVYNMMKCRIKGIEALNNKYGLNVLVDFGSIWHIKNKELVDDIINKEDLPDELQQNEPDNLDNKSGNSNIPESGREPEQGQGQAAETVAEQIKELQAVIDDENSGDDELQQNEPDNLDNKSGNSNIPESGREPEQGQAAETETVAEQIKELQAVIDDENSGDDELQQNEPDNLDNKSGNSNIPESGREPEQGQGQAAETETVAEQIKELQAVIDDENSGDDEKQAAKELIEELKNEKV